MTPPLSQMANAIRILAMDAVEHAQSGHPGMPMGMADVATVLFTHFFQHYPRDPLWPDRDRFVLSAGHGSMLLYSLLYLTGYASMTLDDLRAFRRLGSKTPGHPEYGHTPGVEATTGPLAQGLANAVGMALAEKLLAQDFSPALVNHYTYAIVGDGCLMEGLSQEAISLAGHWQLEKLIVFFDDNGITIDGPASLACSEDTLQRFSACGWDVQSIDGHDTDDIFQAIQHAQNAPMPSLIACRTRIGYGAPHLGGSAKVHGSPLGAEEIKAARQALQWPSSIPFDIPADILSEWAKIGLRAAPTYTEWCHRWEAASPETRIAFTRRQAGHLPPEVLASLRNLRTSLGQPRSTRQASGLVLKHLLPQAPAVLGGSADLSESTQTYSGVSAFSAENPQGRYLHYGVREHAMAGIMNGIALHKGFIPYGSTFLTFSDYARPAIRLAALSGLPVIYIMTHDSIGLGEDGPTHQPIEHLASLRAMPNLNVFRPADSIEVAECWELALCQEKTPSLLCLTRQSIPVLRQGHPGEELLCAKGAYVLCPVPTGYSHQVDLWATGSEVHIACLIQEKLAAHGYGARVISAPCWRLFDQQPPAYQATLRDAPVLKVVIEAAALLGWQRYVGCQALLFGLDSFGASGRAQDLYAHFHLTAEDITPVILTHL